MRPIPPFFKFAGKVFLKKEAVLLRQQVTGELTAPAREWVETLIKRIHNTNELKKEEVPLNVALPLIIAKTPPVVEEAPPQVQTNTPVEERKQLEQQLEQQQQQRLNEHAIPPKIV